MIDSCIVCETEPIDDSDWYRCEKTMEVVCHWCVEESSKLKSKLKMMEISFEQINNSRNDLIRQLAECENTVEVDC